MSDTLNPIRRLYAEPPDVAGRETDELGLAEAAELAALRPVRDALEQLPPLRPDPDVVDEIVATATFQAVRSLYGEGDPRSTLPPAAADEAVFLAPVKEALDRLPRESPRPIVVEEVAAAASAQAVRTLYDEDGARALPPAAAREAALLTPVKSALDALPRERPAPGVIDAVMAAARKKQYGDVGALRDRAPERGRRRRRIAGLAATLVAVGLVALATMWVSQDQSAPRLAAVEAQSERPEIAPESEQGAILAPEAEPALPGTGRAGPGAAEAPPPDRAAVGAPAPARDVPPAAIAEQLAPTRGPAARQPTGVDLAALDFTLADIEESQQSLRLLYLRLEALQEESQLWDEPATTLGAEFPVRPTVSRGWMQVRVDR